MSKTIKIEIEIPAPPEGWGEVEWRTPRLSEMYWNGEVWVTACSYNATIPRPIARKLSPPWTPPPELVSVLKPGWLTRDSFDVVALHWEQPERDASHWLSEGPEWRLNAVKPDLLPPLAIPWEQCCFKIGEPKE